MNKHGLSAEELSQCNERLRLVLDVSQIAVWDWDLESNRVYYSKEWRQLRGIGDDDSSGLPDALWDRVHSDDLYVREARKSQWMEGRKNHFQSEYRVEHQDGTWLRISERVKVLRDSDGKATRIVGAETKIARTYSAESGVQRLSNRLQVVIEAASVGTFEYFPNSDTLICDDRMMRIFDVCPDDLMGTGEDFRQRIHPDDVEQFKTDFAELRESGHVISEFQIRKTGGDYRHVFSDQIVVRSAKNEIEKVTGLLIDVSERRVSRLAPMEPHTQLKVMTDNIPSMLFRYVRYPDGSHQFPFISPGSREIFEVEPQDGIEDARIIFDRIHPEDSIELAELIGESYRDLTPFKVEYRVILPEKGQRWVQAISKPASRDDGAVVWDGLAIDVTQRKETEILLQKAKLKDEFLSNVSHELRTPLNAILGMSEGLQDGIYGQLTKKQLESLKIIEQSGDHLLNLINGMLDLAKIESGQLELICSAVDVPELCESSLRFVAHQANKKNIQLNVELPFNIPKIEADEQRVRQVLINLLDNAVKFSHEGGSVAVKVERIAPTERDAEGTLRFAVTDTGIGVDTSHLDSLFVPFFQVDSSLSRNYEGTGLGLALVKQYVELHAGQIAVVSEPGVGSCFEFTLPYRKPPQNDLPLISNAVKSMDRRSVMNLRTDGSTASPLILLAEDNHDIALATCSYLKAIGYRVLHATDGAMAFDMAVEHSPNLILMDIQMPGVDGLEAMERLRETPENSKTPIIAVTGLARQLDAKRCSEAGANECICKPYRMGDLVKSIQKTLDKQASI